MVLAAEYTRAAKGGVLSFCEIDGGRRKWLGSQNVAGKREARALAAAQNATPWNF